MQKELNLLLPLLQNHRIEQSQGMTFHLGTIQGKQVCAMQCGIGKVNAALGTRALIDFFHPAAVINTGVAGGAGNAASILDVVIGEQVAYHDVWCGPGTQWGEAAACPPRFKADPRCLKITSSWHDPHIKTGLIASGDIFVADNATVQRIRNLYPEVLAIDMESAAIAQTCHLAGVPFLSIRVVSDTPGAADNISQYQNFWEDAPQHTFECLKRIIDQL